MNKEKTAWLFNTLAASGFEGSDRFYIGVVAIN